MVYTFHEYDVVKLKRDMPSIALKAGSIGAIVMVYTKDKNTHAYEVEFVDENGETLALQTLGEDDIEKVEANS